jgi:hypothetical protein
MLHSAFWHHHAANHFELPPFVLAPTPNAAAPGLNTPSSHRKGKSRTRPFIPRPNTEPGVFLDFLYPPQALAFLHRADLRSLPVSSTRDRWEYRNTRRAPESRLQVARGYASKSFPPESEAAAEDGQEEQDNETAGLAASPSDPLREESSRTVDDKEVVSKSKTSQKNQQGIGDADAPEEEDAFSGIDLGSLPPSKPKLSKQEKKLKKKEDKKSRKKVLARHRSDEPWDVEPEASSDFGNQDGEVSFESLDDYDAVDESEQLMPDVPVEIDELELSPGEDLHILRELRRLVARKPASASAEEDALDRAMELYNTLNTQTKPSATLSSLTDALLNWLAEHKNDEADERFVTVWNSAPKNSRSAKPFENAFMIFRAQGQPLRPLHAAMFEAFPSHTELHATAFQSAFEVDDWNSAFHIHTSAMALRPPREHEEVEFVLFRCCEESVSDHDRRKILHVTNWARELPGPISGVKALKLDAVDQDLESRTAFATSVCRFVAAEVTQRLLGTSLYLQRDDPRLDRQRRYKSRLTSLHLQDRRIEASLTFTIDLMNFVMLFRHEQAGTRLAETMMTAMLSLPAKTDDTLTYRLIASIYRSYRTSSDALPSPNLLLLLLERSLRWESNAARSEDNHLPLDTIISDWKRWRNKLSSTAYIRIIRLYADIGESDLVTSWYDQFKLAYPDFRIYAQAMWCLVLVHVRSANVAGADKAFREIAADGAPHGQLPNLRCWTALIHTYARADDVTGAMDAFQAMNDAAEQDPRLKPNEYVYHIVSTMLARKGDVRNVRELLKQSDANANQKTTPMIGSEIMALIKDDRIEEAREILYQSVEQKNHAEAIGSHTRNFNLLLTALAEARDLPGTVSLYKAMKNGQIPPDSGTFAALILALSGTRNDDAALAVIRFQMPKENFMPTALHFGIVMQGFLHIKNYPKVIWVHSLMQQMNIKQNAKTEEIYLTARSHVEQDTESRNAAKAARDLRRSPLPRAHWSKDRVRSRLNPLPRSPEEIRLFADDEDVLELHTQPSKGEVKSSQPAGPISPNPTEPELPRAATPSQEDELSAQPKQLAAEESFVSNPAEPEHSNPAKPEVSEAAEPESRNSAEPELSQPAEPSEEDALSVAAKQLAEKKSSATDIQPLDNDMAPPKQKRPTKQVPSQTQSEKSNTKGSQPPTRSSKRRTKVYGPPTQSTLRGLRARERRLEAQLLDEYLVETIKDFEDTLPFAKSDFSSGTTFQIMADGRTARQYLDHTLAVYGAERALDAVRDLFDRYFTRGIDPPITILAYLMRALHQVKQYKEVDACWALAKEQADRMVAPVILPDLRSPAARAATPATAVDSNALSITARKSSKKDDNELEAPTNVASGQRLMLSRPALFYMNTLVATNRISDAIALVTSLNTEGYLLDNMTWNSFIRHLCSADPPFALLAFQLAERFLIPNFPGWSNVRWKKPSMQDQRSGLQHINARHHRLDYLIPQYQTLIFLSHALLTLRHHESQGTQYLEAEHLQVGGVNLARYVGRLRQIRENAPRTLYAVQSMPRLDDEWQREMRHEEGETGGLFAPVSAEAENV